MATQLSLVRQSAASALHRSATHAPHVAAPVARAANTPPSSVRVRASSVTLHPAPTTHAVPSASALDIVTTPRCQGGFIRREDRELGSSRKCERLDDTTLALFNCPRTDDRRESGYEQVSAKSAPAVIVTLPRI
jgi:hypothetical protein